MMDLKENERMMREDTGGPQILIAAANGKRGRDRRKGGRGGRSRSQPRDVTTVVCFYCRETGHTISLPTV